MAHTTHTITAQLTVAELYMVLGTSWYHAATTYGTEMAAHNNLAQACKAALKAAGQPHGRISAFLQGIADEVNKEPGE